MRRQSLVATMVLHGRIQVGPASLAEWFILRVAKLFIKTSQEALVIYAHCFKESHFELLSVTAQLSSVSVALALQLLLRDLKRAKVF